MKYSKLVKSLFLIAFVFCFKNADAQLASDIPVPVLNKTFIASKKDTIKVLSLDTPMAIQSNSKARKSSPASNKAVLTSEQELIKPNELNRPKNQ